MDQRNKNFPLQVLQLGLDLEAQPRGLPWLPIDMHRQDEYINGTLLHIKNVNIIST